MRCALIAACEIAIIDARTNNLTLINILQDLSSPTFPAIHPRVNLAAILDRTGDEPNASDGTIRIALDDQPVFETPLHIDFQGHLRVRAVAEIQGVVLTRPGILKLSLLHAGNELGSWSLRVNQLGEPQIFVAPEGEPPVPAN